MPQRERTSGHPSGYWKPRARRPNHRKAIILAGLAHFHSVGADPKALTAWWWEWAPTWARGGDGREFATEWRRNRVAMHRLADVRVYPKPYLAARRRADGTVIYKLLKKGDRVRAKISKGQLPGRPRELDAMPRWRDRDASVE